MIAEGPTAEVLQSDVVRQAYLGDVERGVVTRGRSTSDDVSAGYGPFRALFDVSLTVEPGEAVALLGPERRRQDHRRSGGHRAGRADRGRGRSSTATT